MWWFWLMNKKRGQLIQFFQIAGMGLIKNIGPLDLGKIQNLIKRGGGWRLPPIFFLRLPGHQVTRNLQLQQKWHKSQLRELEGWKRAEGKWGWYQLRKEKERTLPSLKLTWHLKMDGWKTSFLLGWPIFRCYVSFREGTYKKNKRKHIKLGPCPLPVTVTTN